MLELLIAGAIATAPIDETAIQEFKEHEITQETQENAKKEKRHTTQEGENLHEIAQRYGSTWQRLFDKNLHIEHPDIISVGTEIIIPEPSETLLERDFYIAPVNTTSTPKTHVSTHQTQARAGWFPVGQCTWWVASKRSVGAWNNASDWLWQAKRDGYATGSVPRAGAVAWRSGHVAYVESVSGSQMTISEANYDYRGSVRTIAVPVSSYSAFIY